MLLAWLPPYPTLLMWLPSMASAKEVGTSEMRHQQQHARAAAIIAQWSSAEAAAVLRNLTEGSAGPNARLACRSDRCVGRWCCFADGDAKLVYRSPSVPGLVVKVSATSAENHKLHTEVDGLARLREIGLGIIEQRIPWTSEIFAIGGGPHEGVLQQLVDGKWFRNSQGVTFYHALFDMPDAAAAAQTSIDLLLWESFVRTTHVDFQDLQFMRRSDGRVFIIDITGKLEASVGSAAGDGSAAGATSATASHGAGPAAAVAMASNSSLRGRPEIIVWRGHGRRRALRALEAQEWMTWPVDDVAERFRSDVAEPVRDRVEEWPHAQQRRVLSRLEPPHDARDKADDVAEQPIDEMSDDVAADVAAQLPLCANGALEEYARVRQRANLATYAVAAALVAEGRVGIEMLRNALCRMGRCELGCTLGGIPPAARHLLSTREDGARAIERLSAVTGALPSTSRRVHERFIIPPAPPPQLTSHAKSPGKECCPTSPSLTHRTPPSQVSCTPRLLWLSPQRLLMGAPRAAAARSTCRMLRC